MTDITYYTTIFYPDGDDKTTQIVLENKEKLLEDEDIQRGYIEKAILIEYFPELFSDETLFGTKSMICEYKWSNDSFDSEEASCTIRLPVK